MGLTEKEIEYMREAGRLAGNALRYAKSVIKPGISTQELDNLLHNYIIENKGISAFYHYEGFPGSTCISVNDVVVHGIPSNKIILKEGDIVSVDLGVKYKGYYSDCARTFPVGKISPEVEKLIKVTEECFYKGIEQLQVGAPLQNCSVAIQKHAEKNGFSVVRELVGHGIGKELHMDPQIPNYKTGHNTYILEENTCLAIEPMINMGKKEIYLHNDDWTISTRDGKPSAHYENTVLLTKNGVEILTNDI
ncbi:MAG: type I methionyl aminopeptidase [Christensenellales bacterium]